MAIAVIKSFRKKLNYFKTDPMYKVENIEQDSSRADMPWEYPRRFFKLQPFR